MTQEDFYLQAGVRHTNGESWRELIEDFYNQFNQMLSVDAIRKRVKRVCNRQNNSNQTTQHTYINPKETKVWLITKKSQLD